MHIFTKNHFKNIDFLDKKNSSDKSISYKSCSNSDSDSDSDSDDFDDTSESSEEESESSDNNTDEDSNESLDDLKIDDDDLFNTKTNGNEFYGDVLNNRLLILKKLGYGSFSSVWMAYDIIDMNLVAIKIINPDDYKDGLLELKIYETLNKINNKYLLTIKDFFQVTPIHPKYHTEEYLIKNKKVYDHIVIILPLLACSTYDLIKCNEYNNGLPLKICKKIIHQTLLGIKELEKNNMMHTDIKPENILVCGLNREAEILLNTIKDINIKVLHDKQFEISKQSSTLDDWMISYNIYKDITKTLIHFIKNDMIDIKKQMKLCKVSSTYIKDIEIKICDFNLVLNSELKIGNKNIEIQTRYYRAPEIILGSGLHKKTDYWSIGCVFFELLTGDLLFNPKKTRSMIRDTHHIFLIEELMGSISQKLLNESRKSQKIFENYPIKKKKNTLKKLLEVKYNNIGLSKSIINNIINFLSITLSIDPDDRPEIDYIINKITNIDKIISL